MVEVHKQQLLGVAIEAMRGAYPNHFKSAEVITGASEKGGDNESNRIREFDSQEFLPRVCVLKNEFDFEKVVSCRTLKSGTWWIVE